MMASEMASNHFPWLTLAIFVPIVFGLLVLALGRDDKSGFTRKLSLVGSIVSFLVTIPLYTGFDNSTVIVWHFIVLSLTVARTPSKNFAVSPSKSIFSFQKTSSIWGSSSSLPSSELLIGRCSSPGPSTQQ